MLNVAGIRRLRQRYHRDVRGAAGAECGNYTLSLQIANTRGAFLQRYSV